MKDLKARTIVMALMAAVLSATLLAPASLAQSPGIKADIPFAFYVQGKLLPAGVYTIRPMVEHSIVRIMNQKGETMIIGTIPTGNKLDAPSRLVFTRYGSVSFLSELDWSGFVGRALTKSRQERELLAGHAPVRLAVLGK